MASEGDDQAPVRTVLHDQEASRRLELAALNYVALGEWEAARAHLTAIAKGFPEEKKRVKEILVTLVLKAREYW